VAIVADANGFNAGQLILHKFNPHLCGFGVKRVPDQLGYGAHGFCPRQQLEMIFPDLNRNLLHDGFPLVASH
jgi:hypothetical protein